MFAVLLQNAALAFNVLTPSPLSVAGRHAAPCMVVSPPPSKAAGLKLDLNEPVFPEVMPCLTCILTHACARARAITQLHGMRDKLQRGGHSSSICR